jgi:hypothetical protein
LETVTAELNLLKSAGISKRWQGKGQGSQTLGTKKAGVRAVERSTGGTYTGASGPCFILRAMGRGLPRLIQTSRSVRLL